MTAHRATHPCAVRGACADDSAPTLGCELKRARRAPRKASPCAVGDNLWITTNIPVLAKKTCPPRTAQETPLKGTPCLRGAHGGTTGSQP